MLRWALVFLIAAICSALIGFDGQVGTAGQVARPAFAVLLGLFLLSLIRSLQRSH